MVQRLCVQPVRWLYTARPFNRTGSHAVSVTSRAAWRPTGLCKSGGLLAGNYATSHWPYSRRAGGRVAWIHWPPLHAYNAPDDRFLCPPTSWLSNVDSALEILKDIAGKKAQASVNLSGKVLIISLFRSDENEQQSTNYWCKGVRHRRVLHKM